MPHPILHVLTSKAWGGLELYVIQLIKKLIDSGFETALYCRPNTRVASEAQKLNIPVYLGVENPHLGIRDIYRITKLLPKFPVLHSHSGKDVKLVSLALWVSGTPHRHIFSLYMSAPRKKNLFYQFIYKKVNAITSSSEVLNLKIKKNFPVLPTHVHLLRYGRDLELYKNDSEQRLKIRQEWNASETDIVVGTMCRIDPAKGVKEFAEAILLIAPEIKKRIKIWIIGEPTLHHTAPNGSPVYETGAQELFVWLQNFITLPMVENRVQLIPFQKNFTAYLEALDIFVLATYTETYSLSVIDAMCMGIPIIGTNSGGTSEQVKDHVRGLLVEPKSSLAIAQAITKYVENASLREEYAESAKRWAQSNHSWANTIKELNSLYTAP